MATIKNREFHTKEEFWSAVTTNEEGLKVFDFENCTFHCEIRIEDEDVHSVKFEECLFNEKFELYTTVQGEANFSQSTFEQEALFSDYSSKNYDNCTGAIFEGNLCLERTRFIQRVDFIKVKFKGQTCFNDAKFEKNSKVRFYSAEFSDDVTFYNTTFHNLADFFDVKFNRIVIFDKTDFLGTTVFAKAKFIENVLFTYSRIDELIIFRETTFKKGLDLSLAIIQGNINTFGIKLKNENYEKVEEKKPEEQYISAEGIIFDENKRETFRILKHHSILQHNSIDSLKYQRDEHLAYSQELWKDISNNKRVKKITKKWHCLVKKILNITSILILILITIILPIALLLLLVSTIISQPLSKLIKAIRELPLKKFFDYLIFWLNKMSNDLGTSYMRGIAFTFFSAWIFFYLALLSSDDYCFAFNLDMSPKVVHDYFNFINPTYSIDFMGANENVTWWFYPLVFIGRVFVAYGIYQTVQAFRKYRKE